MAETNQPGAATEVAAATASTEKKKRAAPRKRVQKKSGPIERTVVVKSKRKEAIARASARRGSGIIRMNNKLMETVEPQELRRFILEPVFVSSMTQDTARSVDIKVNVRGGGMVAQAEATRSAIAKALSEYSGNDVIRKEYLKHDRSMLKYDSRRVEPKKYKGPKARARFQTSYR